jgi:hypothetical protein
MYFAPAYVQVVRKQIYEKIPILWVPAPSPIKIFIINGLFFSSIPRVCTYSR